MNKKDIIINYLNAGNGDKSVRTIVAEILAQSGVNVSVMMVQKTKKEWSVQSVHQESVQSVHQESVQSVHQESVQSVHQVNTQDRSEWLESLMAGITNATNIFQMTEAIRQCDIYVQDTGESIREDIECAYEGLLKWQKLLIDQYGLRNRLSFTK